MTYYKEVQKEIDYLTQFYTLGELVEYAGDDLELIKDLYRETQPKEVEIGSLLGDTANENHYYMVSSPDGWVSVLDCVEKTKDEMFAVEVDGVSINASHDHLFQKSDNSWWYARDLVEGDELITVNGFDKIDNIIPYKEETLVYDLSVNHENHRYYTEGVCSHNTGKSLFLQNIASKHWREGKNVIYFTLELHPELCARRMDAMNLDQSTDSLYEDIDNVDLTLRKMGTKAGKMKIVYMPSGTKTSEIKSFIEDYQLNTGIEVDSIFIDYLDLLNPVQKVSLGDTFHKDKFVAEELRNMSQDMETVCFTASQINRDGNKSGEDMGHEHIAGGISKINTADLVIGIIIDDNLRQEGKYILKALKVRNGAGTGALIDLLYNTFTMKIEDDPSFLQNINTYMKSPQKRVVSETEKTMIDIQNQLNSNNKDYDPVDIETGKVIPRQIANNAGLGRLDKIHDLLNDDNL